MLPPEGWLWLTLVFFMQASGSEQARQKEEAAAIMRAKQAAGK